MPQLTSDELREYEPPAGDPNDRAYYLGVADGMDEEQAGYQRLGYDMAVTFDTGTGLRVYNPPLPELTPEQRETMRSQIDGSPNNQDD